MSHGTSWRVRRSHTNGADKLWKIVTSTSYFRGRERLRRPTKRIAELLAFEWRSREDGYVKFRFPATAIRTHMFNVPTSLLPFRRAGHARTAFRPEKTANAPVANDSELLKATISVGLDPTK